MDISKCIEEFVEIGKFWIENQEELHVGMLSVEANGKIKLEIYNDFSTSDFWRVRDSDERRSASIISGQLKNGQTITLVDCHYLFDGIWTATFLLKGGRSRYEDANDINFNKARVTFTDLEKWLPRQVSASIDREKKMITSKLQQAPKHKITSMDCEVTLGYSWKVQHEDSSFATSGYLEFCFEETKNFRECLEIAGYFSSLLTLCLDVAVDIEKICLFNNNWDTAAQLIYQKRRNAHERKAPSDIKILPYNALKNGFTTYISNWYSLGLTGETRDSLAIFMESYEHSIPLEITFLLLVQSWQGVANQIWRSKGGKPGKTQREVINSLFESIRFVFPDFINNNRDELVKKIVNSRNYYIKNSGKYSKSDILDRDSIFIITILLSLMIRIRLLLEIGISESEIGRILHLDKPDGLKYMIGNYVYKDLEVLCSKLETDAPNNNPSSEHTE